MGVLPDRSMQFRHEAAELMETSEGPRPKRVEYTECRFWRSADATPLGVTGWFAEGFDAAGLKEVEALLERTALVEAPFKRMGVPSR